MVPFFIQDFPVEPTFFRYTRIDGPAAHPASKSEWILTGVSLIQIKTKALWDERTNIS